MKTYTYQPKGVCSRQIVVEVDEDRVITDVRFVGGCSGNTQGVAALVIGQKADDVIPKIENIRCGGKTTSCPAQLAIALKRALEAEK
ncbi:MAG: TIGR03905 family TSCPD domain-containing protein [Clostridiales bacterium]|nr:TIGR03905 family TSCPD domain-containing protein [Clostridiales bacterium]